MTAHLAKPTFFLSSLLLLCALVLGIPTQAEAQDPSSQGTLVMSADNLFGLAIGNLDFERNPGNDREHDYTIFGLGMSADPTPLWTPRFALDGFVIDRLSVGGSLGIIFWDDDDDNDNDDGVAFFLAPRVGYLYMFSSSVGIWARGGFTYYTYDQDFFDRSQLALDLEAMFPFVINEGFALVVGPAAHIGISGEYDNNNNNNDNQDFDEWGIGISFGIMGWVGL